MVLLLYAVCFAIPYLAFKAARHLTGSLSVAWVAALLMFPVGVVAYIRLFERLKHRGRDWEVRRQGANRRRGVWGRGTLKNNKDNSSRR
jgi:uncharacterized membrane protein